MSRTILRDILVVKAPEAGTKAAITSSSSGSSGPESAQLKLSDTAARELFWMMTERRVDATLRSPVQASNGKDDYDDSGKLLLPALPAAMRQAVQQRPDRVHQGARQAGRLPVNPEKTRVYMTGACDGHREAPRDARQPRGARAPRVERARRRGRRCPGRRAPPGRAPRDPVVQPAGERARRDPGATRAPIILVASGEASDLLEDALEADVADVLLLPQLTENVVFAIKKATHAGRRAGRRGRAQRAGSSRSSRRRAGRARRSSRRTSRVALAKYEGRRTLLLDLDLQFGDAAIMLGLEPDKTIFDLVVAPGELDSEKLAGYTVTHASGLDVLPAPLRPEDAELVTEAKLGRLLEVARASYDTIVVDTSPFFHGPMLATLDRTDELLLLASLDVPTLKNVRLSMHTLDLLSFPHNRVRIVLNRANSTRWG